MSFPNPITITLYEQATDSIIIFHNSAAEKLQFSLFTSESHIVQKCIYSFTPFVVADGPD